jgi:hypothetical protein
MVNVAGFEAGITVELVPYFEKFNSDILACNHDDARDNF